MSTIAPMKNRVSRAQWQARPPRDETPLKQAQVKGCAVHYSASNADEQANHLNCAGRVRAIQNYHMDTRGWNDIAYNFVVCKHGYIFVGRGWYTRSAGQGTNAGNDQYLAVCFLGDDTAGRDDVTADGRAAFKRVFARFKVWYGRKAVLKPHSYFTATSCPGDQLRAWIKTL